MTMTARAKGDEMMEYEFRLDYEDGTFDVVSVEAENIGAARARVQERYPDATGTPWLLAMIDREPIEPFVRYQ